MLTPPKKACAFVVATAAEITLTPLKPRSVPSPCGSSLASQRRCRYSRGSHAGPDDPMETIEDWLGRIGLGKYTAAFVRNDVDLRSLPYLSDADLQELGVSLGHRKLILAAIPSLDHAAFDTSPPVLLPTTDAPREPTADRRLLSVLFCDL